MLKPQIIDPCCEPEEDQGGLIIIETIKTHNHKMIIMIKGIMMKTIIIITIMKIMITIIITATITIMKIIMEIIMVINKDQLDKVQMDKECFNKVKDTK